MVAPWLQNRFGAQILFRRTSARFHRVWGLGFLLSFRITTRRVASSRRGGSKGCAVFAGCVRAIALQGTFKEALILRRAVFIILSRPPPGRIVRFESTPGLANRRVTAIWNRKTAAIIITNTRLFFFGHGPLVAKMAAENGCENAAAVMHFLSDQHPSSTPNSRKQRCGQCQDGWKSPRDPS